MNRGVGLMGLEDDLNDAGKEELFKEKSEMGEFIESLDDDAIDKRSQRSKIDFNTRLTSDQISNVLALEELKRSGILSFVEVHVGLKRMNVSKDGQGRREKVEAMVGQREQQNAGGFLRGMFQRRE